MTSSIAEDRLAIKQLIEDWVLWRDSGDWDRLASTWWPDGFIMTTWCEATTAEFMERSRKAHAGGLQVFHTVNGSHVEVEGDRAFAQTKMQIINRAPVHGVLMDVTCQGRFCDAFERRDGRWRLFSRQSIYEGDRFIPVEVGAQVALDKDLLATFPDGYKHLGYLQINMGLPVNKNLPGGVGPAADGLLARMRAWLAGGERNLVRSVAATT